MITAWTPSTLDVDGLVQLHGTALGERVLHLGHTVRTRLAVDPRMRDSGQVPLSSEILRRVLGWRYVNAVRDLAASIGYVERDRSYSAGRFSQSYRIGRQFAHARLEQYKLTDAGLLENIRRERERMAEEQRRRLAAPGSTIAPEVFDHLRKNLDRLRIDRVEPQTPTEQIVIDRIQRRASWAKVCDYGRLHTVLTSLPRRLRPHLHVADQRLVGVDIGESQPLFIAVGLMHHPSVCTTTHTTPKQAPPLMLHHDHQTDNDSGQAQRGDGPNMLHQAPPDLDDWLRLCESRQLYRTVANVLGVDRKAAKEPVMAALFGKPSHTTRASEALRGTFPATWEAILTMKRQHSYATLAHQSQRAESEFIFRRCVRRLMAEHPEIPVLTIHDSIVTIAGQEGIVERIMRDEFRKLGLQPTLTAEQFSGKPC